MPELPEVETARRIVERELVGQSIVSILVRLPKLLRFSELQPPEILVGRTVIAARRRAKLLIIDFSGDLSMMVHFKLAGQISILRPDGRRITAGHPVPDPEGPYPHKATHVELHFADGSIAYFSDIRQFGWFRIMPTRHVPETIAQFALGPEGTGEGQISNDELQRALSRRSVPIKLVLLDQQAIAGVGNIYADEALHRARIHPSQPANSLTRPKIARLRESIAWALELGIAQGGAKIIHQRAYPVDNFPAVHGREGMPCPNCASLVKKITVGTRGTYFCPKCQRLRTGRSQTSATAGNRNRAATSARIQRSTSTPNPGRPD